MIGHVVESFRAAPARNRDDDRDIRAQSNDDESEDETPRLVAEFASTHPQIRLLKSGSLREGWTGKTQACWTGASAAPANDPLVRGADLVLLHGKIWTGEPAAPPGVKATPAKFAQAVAIPDGRIVAVGTDAEIRPYVASDTQVVDLGGRLALPGFIDAHVHFLAGSFQLLQVNLKRTRDEAAKRGWKFEKLAGNLAMIQRLVNGVWDAKEFLVVPPGHRIAARYDEGIISAEAV